MSGRSYLSIGDVLSLLREEFPDVTISKIRFLESQGLVDPERSASGYRKFYERDVERLLWVLRQQREHFLPLKVIRDRLDAAGNGVPPDEPYEPETENGADAVDGADAGSSADSAGGRAEEAAERPAPVGTPSVATGLSWITAERERLAALSGAGVHGSGGSFGALGARAAYEERVALGGRDAGAGSHGGRSGNGSTEWSPTSLHPADGEDAGWGTNAGPVAASSAGPADPGGLEPLEPDPAAPPLGAAPEHVPAHAAPEPAHPVPAHAPGAHVGTAPGGRARREPASRAPVTAVPPRAAAATTPATGVTSPAFGADVLSASVSGVSLTLEELCSATGLSVAQVGALEGFGLLSPMAVAGVAYYDEEALTVAKLVVEFGRYGVEPRHLRLYRNAVDREVGLIEQVITPLLRQRNPEARQKAVDAASDLVRLGQGLRASLVRAELRRQLGN